MRNRLTLRADTTAEWSRLNPMLALREMVYDTTAEDFKIGDGVRPFVLLPYVLAAKVVFRGLFAPGSYLQGQYVEGADGFAYVARRNVYAIAQPVSGPNWRKTSWGTVVGGGPAPTGATITEWEPKIYSGDLVVVLFDFTMYQLTAPQPFDSTDFADELDFGQWTPICCENNGSGSNDYLQCEDGRRLQAESGETFDV